MEIRATMLGGTRPRIAVEFYPLRARDDYEIAGELADMVVGARWRNGIKRWVYPLTIEKCREMREAWGPQLRVESPLSAWYRSTVESQRRQAVAGTRADGVLRRVPQVAPALYARMAPDQRAGAAWIATAYRGAGIYAPEAGVGKTRAVLAGIIERGVVGRVLIVCPKISVDQVWGKELAEFTDYPVHLARGTRVQREEALREFDIDPHETKLLVIVAEMLRVKAKMKNGKLLRDTWEGYEFPGLFSRPWDTVVIDESQKLLASLSIVRGTLAGEGLRRLPQSTEPTSLRLAVSGTPFGGGGEVYGMFGSLHWCWPDEYTSFWNWAKENFVVTERQVSRTKTVQHIGRLRREGGAEAFFRSLGPRIFRRTMDEVSEDHRGKLSWHVIPCGLHPHQAAQYKDFALNGEVTTPGGVVAATGALAEMTRARQIANGEITMDDTGKVIYTGCSGKIVELIQQLRLRGALLRKGSGRYVIASQWNEMLLPLCVQLEVMGVEYHLLTGRTSLRERERMMNTFQSGEGPRLFIMNAKTGGVSINLDVADELHQIDEMYPPELNEQLHRRIFRRSRAHEARIYYYRSVGTIDEKVAGDVAEKLHEQLRALDGRRGRQIVRQLIKLTATTAGKERKC